MDFKKSVGLYFLLKYAANHENYYSFCFTAIILFYSFVITYQ